jgi:DNA polymerase III alpha subunit
MEEDFLYDGERRTMEKVIKDEFELCACYVRNDPLSPFADIIDKRTNAFVSDFVDGYYNRDNKVIKMAGVLVELNECEVKKKTSKLIGRKMAIGTLEHNFARVKVIFFPDVYDIYKSILKTGLVYLMSGEVGIESSSMNDMEENLHIVGVELLSTIEFEGKESEEKVQQSQ